MIRLESVGQCRTLTHTYFFKTAESDLTLKIYDLSQKCVFKKTFSQVDIAPNTQFSLSNPSVLLETMRQKNLIPFESIHSIPTVEECSKDIAVYRQTLTEDPYHFKTYPLLAALLSNPREKAHVFLTGACYALRKEEYQLARDFCSQAEELHEDSFIDRLVELDLLAKQGGLPKDKLLQIAALYEKKNLPELMIKAYRMLTQLDRDPPAYCYEKIIIGYDKIQKPKKALQWTHSYFNSLIKDKKWQQVVTSYSNLGSDYSAQKRYSKAIEFFEQALEILKEDRGENHLDVATLLNKLGTIYYTQKQTDKAIEYFKQSLKILEEALGKNHSKVAVSFLYLGHVYREQKQYDNAIKLYEQALIGIEKDNPHIATLLDALGSVYYAKEQYDEAIECYKRALGNIKNKNGSVAAQLFSDLGSAYKAKKWYSEAIELHKQAIEILETVLGKDHPRAAIFINKLGIVYHAQEEYDKAIECFEHALEIRKKALDPRIAIFLKNLGIAHHAKEEYDKAIGFYEQALKALEEVRGRDHPEAVTLLNNIDKAYKAQGQRGKAIKLELSEN